MTFGAPGEGPRGQASPGAVLLVVFGAFERACVAKAERAYMWCGLHWCRVVVCGTGGRCPCLVGCPFVVGSLRCAGGLAGAFWRVFPEPCLGGSGGGSPRTYLRCFCSSACYSILSDGCILVRFSLDVSWHFWWRFSPKLLRAVLVIAALSLCRGELSSLSSAWALSVEGSCP
ncbi:hypothetical protein Taro_026088 [Colocasia esculenta]|uniref:Uncharacterized protein n=1 Tax=Colocasia esculenta TaxID=4460 RepID=A0A843VJJ6_COLES|nr:hypothetical protein [Colocasia esculenta]